MRSTVTTRALQAFQALPRAGAGKGGKMRLRTALALLCSLPLFPRSRFSPEVAPLTRRDRPARRRAARSIPRGTMTATIAAAAPGDTAVTRCRSPPFSSGSVASP